jgi:N-methylhydantoinase B
MRSKVTTSLGQGCRIQVVTPGGGGWGPPEDRDAQAVRRDVHEGLVSPERAAAVYRTALDPQTLEVDWPATVALRKP